MWRIGPIGALTIVAVAALGAVADQLGEPTPDRVTRIEGATAEAGPAPTLVEVDTPRPVPFSFAPRLLPPIRRPLHAPSQAIYAVPGGPFPYQVARSDREGHCADALSAASHAVESSPDYGRLLITAWSCFDRQHQARLLGARAESLTSFLRLQPHFRGDRRQSVAPEVPSWMQPPTGGIAYRLHAFMGSSRASADLRSVVLDQLGAPSTTDTLAQDVQLILDGAVALAESERQSPVVHEAWAHLVFQATRILDNEVMSKLLRAHRSGDIRTLESQYDRATTARDGSLPAVVQRAMDLGVSP